MPQKRPLPVLITLIAACISYSLSQTMVVPTLPVLVEHFHTTESAASWLLTGFLLSASIATPIAGKLGDLYGKGRVLTGVMTIFAIGAIVCGLAGTIGVLIAGRVLQGVAGGVFPLAFGVVRDTFPRQRDPRRHGDHQRGVRDRRRDRPAARGHHRRPPAAAVAVLGRAGRRAGGGRRPLR